MKKLLILVFLCSIAATPRTASYSKQSSSGGPLIISGRIDTTAVKLLASFDDVTFEAVPWAQDGNGFANPTVPLLVRHYNPHIRLWLYMLTGDFWVNPETPGYPPTYDHSAYADVYRILAATNGWLYGTDGQPWVSNYRVNLGNRVTADSLTALYLRLLSTHLYDAIFMDCASTSIAWTNNGAGIRRLDVARAGFYSLAAMDSARAVNIRRMIDTIHNSGCYLVAINGTGPRAGEDVDFREGLLSLTSLSQAMAWVQTPGTHWLKAECYYPEECDQLGRLERIIAAYGSSVIISLGPNRDWPPIIP